MSPEPSEVDLIERTLDALAETTGIRGRIRRLGSRGDGPDAIIEFSQRLFAVEAKRTVDRSATLSAAANELQHLVSASNVDGGVLVSEYLSTVMIERCRLMGLNAVDASGNAFLRFDDTLVLVSGRRPKDRKSAQRLGWSSAGVRVGLLVLSTPDFAERTYREISAAAGVALGSVGPALEWFERRGFLSDERRRVRRHAELLSEWSVAYETRVRPRLASQRFASSGPLPRSWWNAEDVTPGCWSGETGAALALGDFRPELFTIYVNREDRTALVRRLARTHRLRADPAGHIEIVDQFWNFEHPDRRDVAPWPLVYADLLRAGDPRTLELADRLRQEHLANRT